MKKYLLMFDDPECSRVEEDEREQLIKEFNAFLKGKDSLFVMPPGAHIAELEGDF